MSEAKAQVERERSGELQREQQRERVGQRQRGESVDWAAAGQSVGLVFARGSRANRSAGRPPAVVGQSVGRARVYGWEREIKT